MPNRLAAEKSPYLLQHAENPVNWYPWGHEALEAARTEDRPILVSIGYSACHWCHVMAHESFEDERVAALMNDRFVNIKVDREERPDVDAIYMDAVQALSGHGGWPLNVFLTPDGRPFFGGTYFPPVSRHGLPSWESVLQSVSDAYRERRDDVLQNAGILTDYIRSSQNPSGANGAFDESTLQSALQTAVSSGDWTSGGFGGAPKFPQPLALEFLLRMYRRTGDRRPLDLVLLTLARMEEGGIHDALGGGFHRYSVDGVWLVPHFEKMLYDNALLARVYLYAFQITGDERWRHTVEETLDYLVRDLTSPEGAFYSAEDADSGGVEGKFYVWTPEDLSALLTPEEASIAAMRFGITPGGNFEGKTILTLAASETEIAQETGLDAGRVRDALARAAASLLAARSRRVRPGLDTKVLTGWNGLTIRALAEAGAVLSRPDYTAAAARAADFIDTAMQPGDTLVRSYRDGPSTIPGYLEDYAFMAEALLALYGATFDPTHLQRARAFVDEAVTRFWDETSGAFFDVASDADSLIVRPRGVFDNPIPSGNAAIAHALLTLSAHTGEAAYEDQAKAVLASVGGLLARVPLGMPYALCALELALSTVRQLAVVGTPGESATDVLIQEGRSRFDPHLVIAAGMPDCVALLEGREAIDGKPTAYVCEHFTCWLPVTDVHALRRQLWGEPESAAATRS